MIGGSSALINFDSSEWANQANAQLQNALQSGLQYSEKYAKQGIEALQDYGQQARADLQRGFEQSQALTAPQRLATYGALDRYQGLLGLPTPVGGSFQLAQGMENAAMGQPNVPFQAQQAAGYNQGLLSTVPSQQPVIPPAGQPPVLPNTPLPPAPVPPQQGV